jgi:uncharacterized protein HemX
MSKTQDKKKKKEQHRVASVRKEIQQKRKQWRIKQADLVAAITGS